MLEVLITGRQSWKKGVPRTIDAKGETDAAVRIDVETTLVRGRTARTVERSETAVWERDGAAPIVAKRRSPQRKANPSDRR